MRPDPGFDPSGFDNVLVTFLNRLCAPSMLVGPALTVRYANEAALALGGADAPATIDAGRLIPAGGLTNDVMSDFLASVRDGRSTAALLPLAGGAAMLAGPAMPDTAWVILSLPGGAPPVDADALRFRYGLSRAEADILASLASGLGTADIAAGRGAALATVRSQMKSLFVKLGARSQGHAIAVALGAALPKPGTPHPDTPRRGA